MAPVCTVQYFGDLISIVVDQSFLNTHNGPLHTGKTICPDKWACGKLIEFVSQLLAFCRNIYILLLFDVSVHRAIPMEYSL